MMHRTMKHHTRKFLRAHPPYIVHVQDMCQYRALGIYSGSNLGIERNS
jgi:hypothetical protein